MVTLSADERILLTDGATYHGTRGTLLLTNERLRFEYEKRGILFKRRYSSVSLPLERISDVTVMGFGPFKKIAVNTVKDKTSHGLPRHEFNVGDAETWKAEIVAAKTTQAEEIAEHATTRETVKVRCTYCGMLTESTLSNCPNCGALLN